MYFFYIFNGTHIGPCFNKLSESLTKEFLYILELGNITHERICDIGAELAVHFCIINRETIFINLKLEGIVQINFFGVISCSHITYISLDGYLASINFCSTDAPHVLNFSVLCMPMLLCRMLININIALANARPATICEHVL